MTDYSLSMFRDRDDMIDAMRREIVRLRKMHTDMCRVAGEQGDEIARLKAELEQPSVGAKDGA